MPRDASGPRTLGGGIADRLSRRLETGQLDRVSIPGGGHAYRGELATRALESLGARAMTLDRSIIVREDFDPGRAEDQALFAHEQYHADHGDGGGGGGGGENFRDAEEIAARAVERMALNRAMEGGYEGGHSAGAGGGSSSGQLSQGTTVGAGAQGADEKPAAKRTPEPAAGYAAMRRMGMNHADVVEELCRRVIDATDEKREIHGNRAGNAKHTV